jgi:hypothetical protein
MKYANLLRVCAVAASLLPATLGAQDTTTARPAVAGPPIQRINTASALSVERLGAIVGVRELPDGRVLVNDGARRRLLLMDTTLKNVEVVLDSLSDIANTYGTRPGALIPYRGDSTLFIDPVSYAIVVLDQNGRMTRIRSVWRVEHIPYFTSTFGGFGWPGIDARGRVVHRVPARPGPPRVRPPAGIPYLPIEPDSAFVVAVDLDTRKTDTLGTIRIPKAETRVRQTADRGFNFDQVVNPLPTTDEWAVLPNGAVAFVRWRDYRIEYLQADGTRTSSPKLPYDWQRLTDEDKQRIVDSTRVAQQKQLSTQFVASMIRWVNQYGKDYPVGFTVPEGFTMPPGFPKDWVLPAGVKFPANYIYACAPGVEPPPMMMPGPAAAVPGAAGAPAAAMCFPAPVTFSTGGTPPMPTARQALVMSASDLPDYRPPIGTGSVRADMQGNLWIRTNPTKPLPGGPVYDIVSPAGEVINRFQLPPGYSIVGFGKDKIVYLSMRDQTGLHLARVRLK